MAKIIFGLGMIIMSKQEVSYQTVALFHEIAKILAPPPKMKVSDWADNYRVLSEESSAECGRWKTSRAEFQREIMDAINEIGTESVIIKSSAQIGKTEIILNILAYYIDYDPSPIMIVYPTVEMGEAFSKDRLAPMLRDCDKLRGKIKDSRTRDSNNTILHKNFPGGQLTIAGSNSPSSLCSRPIRIVLMDEIDRYPQSAGDEGDPIALAEKRTNTFWNRKKIKVSTPTVEGLSKIDREYKHGTMERWCVECPCCGEWQPYDFNQIQFKDVTMECKNCKEHLTEQEWKESNHKWIAEHPESKKIRSFHINELSSPWKHWDEIIKDYLKAYKEYENTGLTDELRVFVNTSLGECWREIGDGADEKVLLERREWYEAELPEGVLLLTAGVDVQKEHFEIEVVGWAKKYISWGIYKTELFCNPALEESWDKLEEYLEKEFCFQDGTKLHIACTCLDTGGSHTNNSYKFIKRMREKNKKIYGIKGYSNTPGIPLIYKKTKVEIKDERGRVLDKTEIFILGVDAGKEDIISRLKIKEEDLGGYCHFPVNEGRGYDKRYMAGITSEEKVTKVKNGKMKIAWVKKSGIRNEPLDLRNYAYAAEQLLKPNYDKLEEKLKNGIDYTIPVKKKKHKRGKATQGLTI